tara:strand:+ start:3183 stop:3506 length:324 start_codon:yes stop_codon:yes gene_type:complete
MKMSNSTQVEEILYNVNNTGFVSATDQRALACSNVQEFVDYLRDASPALYERINLSSTKIKVNWEDNAVSGESPAANLQTELTRTSATDGRCIIAFNEHTVKGGDVE